jgi:arginine repressor
MTDGDTSLSLLITEARIARQRDLVARLKATGCDTSMAKSVLSALRYSLRLLKRHQRRSHRSGTVSKGHP